MFGLSFFVFSVTSFKNRVFQNLFGLAVEVDVANIEVRTRPTVSLDAFLHS